MKTISAKIPDSDSQVLEKLAQSTPGGISAVVRAAVHEYCQKENKDKSSRNAVIREAFGAFKDAPLDAKKHRKNLSERMI